MNIISIVSLSQLDNCPQMIFVRHKLSCQINGRRCGIDECDRSFETFNIKTSEHLQWKAIEKLVHGEDMFLIQAIGLGKFESCGARTSNSTKRGTNLKVELKRQKLN